MPGVPRVFGPVIAVFPSAFSKTTYRVGLSDGPASTLTASRIVGAFFCSPPPLVRSLRVWAKSWADWAITASCREAMMPLVIRWRSSCPTTRTTTMPSTTVVATTRSCIDRRH
jgi:hypothetical protein